MTLTCDKARWTMDGEGCWACFRADRGEAQAIVGKVKEGAPHTLEVKRKKRSLDANSYYWCLLGKLAEALHISTCAAHNLMLRRYGQLEMMDGKLVYLVVPDTEEAENKALEAETYHIKPTSQTKQGRDGLDYRTYMMLRGSSTYDTKEMAALIDGIVGECRQVGIETLPPDKLAILKEGGGCTK